MHNRSKKWIMNAKTQCVENCPLMTVCHDYFFPAFSISQFDTFLCKTTEKKLSVQWDFGSWQAHWPAVSMIRDQEFHTFTISYKPPATSKTVSLVLIINNFPPLTFFTKTFILDVAGVPRSAYECLMLWNILKPNNNNNNNNNNEFISADPLYMKLALRPKFIYTKKKYYTMRYREIIS